MSSSTALVALSTQDPLLRIWSGPNFEVILISSFIHASGLCSGCKENTLTSLTSKLDEINLSAQLNSFSFTSFHPSLQNAKYQLAVVGNVLYLACVQSGLRITIDPKQILYAMRQSTAYQDMLARWAVGADSYPILFALEGEMDHLDLAPAYHTRFSGEQDLFQEFTAMHWERFRDFESRMRLSCMNNEKILCPCECWDMKFPHEKMIEWYEAYRTEDRELPPFDIRTGSEVVWAMVHVLTHVTKANPQAVLGSVEGWVGEVKKLVGDRDEDVAVEAVMVMLQDERFKEWLRREKPNVDRAMAMMENRLVWLRDEARKFADEIIEGQLCPDFGELQL